MEEFEKITESQPNSLRQQLEDAGIDTSKWGTGESKTLAHLQKEIDDGETVLTTDESGDLIRRVEFCGGDIYFVSSDGMKHRLKEEKQVFKDGRERKRDLGHAVSEKMKLGEDHKEAMIRGLREELGIDGDVAINEIGTDKEDLPTSPSYSGLPSQYIRHRFEIVLNDKQFKPEGYIEESSDMSTFFVWEQLK